MKKRKKTGRRCLSLLLAAAMIFGFVPTDGYGTEENMANAVKAAETVTAETKDTSDAEDTDVTLYNPRIVEDSSMTAGQKVTWDCVYFGSYPQTEVVLSGSAEETALEGMNESYTTKYKSVSASQFEAIEDAAYDSNGDSRTKIGGYYYRRMTKSDATGVWHYSWADSTSYHYFRYEPIKWRVLEVSGGKALLLADVALDDQQYHTDGESVTWETSTIRSWLNGYAASKNQGGDSGEDYSSDNFIDAAFTSSEQAAIKTTTVENADNSYYGTEGGEDTEDKIFLLSETECWGEKAATYGFGNDYSRNDEGRISRISTYAYAMGTYRGAGNCTWWLRSPGGLSYYAAAADNGDKGSSYGDSVTNLYNGIRPALTLDLSYTSLYTYAGTVCSDGTVYDGTVFQPSIYAADYLLTSSPGKTNETYFDSDTPSAAMYANAKDNGLLTISTYYSEFKKILSAVESPSSIIDADIDNSEVYEGILYALFENSANETGATLSSVKDKSSYASGLFNAISDMMKAEYTMDHVDLTGLTEKQISRIQKKTEKYFKNNGFMKMSSSISKIVKAISCFDDLTEYCEYVTNCIKLAQVGEDYIEVFRTMHDECSERSLKVAINNCISMMESSQAELVLKMADRAVDIVGNEIMKHYLDAIIKEMKASVALAHPAVLAFWAAYHGGDVLSNVLFSTDATVETTLKFEMCVEIRESIQKAYADLKSAFEKEESLDNAENFLACIDIFYQYLEEDCDTAISFVNTIDDSLCEKILKKMGWSSETDAKEEVEVQQGTYRNSWLASNTYWVYALQADDPDEYENYKDLVSNETMTAMLKDRYDIECPVDVYVYNGDGDLIGSVIDGQTTVYDEDALGLSCIDDKKTVWLYGEEEYTISCKGTGSGTMHIKITDYDDEGNPESVEDYREIAVTEGSLYSIADTLSEENEEKGHAVVNENDSSEEPIYPETKTPDVSVTSCSHPSVETLSEKIEATCTEDGRTEVKACRICGLPVSGGTIAATGHTWGDWQTVREATALAEGLRRSTCSVCGETREETIPKLASSETSQSLTLTVTSTAGTAVSTKIAAGKTVLMKATVPVTWTSSNPKVATVDASGRVTFLKKAGGKSVTITATPTDGSAAQSMTFRCMKGAVKKITLSGKKTVKAGKKLKLKARVKTTKGKANKKLLWTSSNPKLATVSASGVVKTKKGAKGKVKITAMATDGSNKKKTVAIRVK